MRYVLALVPALCAGPSQQINLHCSNHKYIYVRNTALYLSNMQGLFTMTKYTLHLHEHQRRLEALHIILLIIAFTCWAFHVTLNSRNTLLKKQWRSLRLIRYLDHASPKHHSNVLCFVKALEFLGEISK